MIVTTAEVDDFKVFQAEHLETAEAQQLKSLTEQVPAAMLKQLLYLTARTFFDERSNVIGMMGVWPLWPGVGRAWSMLTPALLRRPKSLHRYALSQLLWAEENLGLRRVESVVEDGNPAAHRWIKRLGFRHEAEMPHYGLNGVGTFHLYARIDGWQDSRPSLH